MSDAFPLDFDSLVKGSIVHQETIERIYQVKFSDDPDRYSFGQMRLAQEIRNHREDLVAHVRNSGRDILIMTDVEACKHTFDQVIQSQRRVVTFTTRRAAIDQSEFSEQDRKIGEARDRASTAMMAMARKAIGDSRREQLFLDSAKDKSGQ